MMARTSLFVDTSGWAASIDRGDTFYQQAQQIIQTAYQQNRPFVTSNYVLCELARFWSEETSHAQPYYWPSGRSEPIRV